MPNLLMSFVSILFNFANVSKFKFAQITLVFYEIATPAHIVYSGLIFACEAFRGSERMRRGRASSSEETEGIW